MENLKDKILAINATFEWSYGSYDDVERSVADRIIEATKPYTDEAIRTEIEEFTSNLLGYTDLESVQMAIRQKRIELGIDESPSLSADEEADLLGEPPQYEKDDPV